MGASRGSSALAPAAGEACALCLPLTSCSVCCSLESIRQCGVALCILLGFSVLSASIGSSVVRDRASGAKRLQHISGLGYGTYWFANFLCDMVGHGSDVLCAPRRRSVYMCGGVCMCVYMCMCVFVHVYMCTHVHAQERVCVHVCVCVYTCPFACM